MLAVYALTVIYLLATIPLAAYGFNSWFLTLLYIFVARRTAPAPGQYEPTVTVQLPVYNERWVVRRLIDAAASLDYPRHRLQIQVLDDSTDDTTSIAAAAVQRWRQAGVDIKLIHRRNRLGYKAGALARGLRQAKGEFIAIFDADFLPPRDWLRATVPHFAGRPDVGFVQTRWGHLNGDYSPITRAQVLALDGHFMVEQTARQRGGLLMGFNGTAGIWRRKCLEDAGGWDARTVCEDLDLSFRAQLAGWRCLYLPHVVAPAEVPALVSAFKRQQRRWAMGSTQCLRHLTKPILKSRLPVWTKAEALIHLAGYANHLLSLIVLLITLPVLFLKGGLPIDLAFLGIAGLGPPLLFTVGQLAQGLPSLKRLLYLPMLVILGMGIACSNSVAVINGLLHDGGEFQRTPKFSLQGASGEWKDKRYALGLDSTTAMELVFTGYALATMVMAWLLHESYAMPFLAFYAVGFGYVGLSGVLEQRLAREHTKQSAALQRQTSSSSGIM